MPAKIVATTPDAPWLPPGGRAEVVLDRGSRAPAPTGLVRLLLHRDDAVFCVRRGGVGKLDLPTRAVPALDDGLTTIESLTREILSRPTRPRLVGYVRNIIEAADAGYPWPVPRAHFSVWEARGEPAVAGEWLSARDPSSLLHDRHWWPLLRATGACGNGC